VKKLAHTALLLVVIERLDFLLTHIVMSAIKILIVVLVFPKEKIILHAHNY